MTPTDHSEWFVAALAAIGASIGIGKLLNSTDKLTIRVFFGRAIVNAGIGAAAGAVMLWAPSAPAWVLYSCAAGLASLGSSTLEYILKKRLGGNGPEPEATAVWTPDSKAAVDAPIPSTTKAPKQ
ncbi:hypothetical protein GNX71_18615 [Variovorax sp. RKNM96]|uniref:hypothetical protein n=1 Tax=Variovorax sp. RKNM96 TaxID=2681552 RepID=UPI0019816107|nr:hypothetical protein [Variovorax sp. RKNM96]QSI31482.1 hypothetical protein GNX71_18615 [Variovorax sp. RKNM96]